MSSVKRRKVDDSVPSGLLKKNKKTVVEKPTPESASTSPEPTPAATEEPEEEVEVKKTFKDLVIMRPWYLSLLLLTLTRALLIHYATRAMIWDTKPPLQSKPNQYHSHCKAAI
jgi:hypothetical protein